MRNVRRRTEGGALEFLLYDRAQRYAISEEADEEKEDEQAEVQQGQQAEDLICEECGEADFMTEVLTCKDCKQKECVGCESFQGCMACRGSICRECYPRHSASACDGSFNFAADRRKAAEGGQDAEASTAAPAEEVREQVADNPIENHEQVVQRGMEMPRRRLDLDDSDGDLMDEDFAEQVEEQQLQAEHAVVHRRLNQKTPEDETNYKKKVEVKRKYDYADVSEATNKFRKIMKSDFEKHVASTARLPINRELKEIEVESPHDLVKVEGRWGKVHPSHTRAMVNQILFCSKCGAWMSSHCKGLSEVCHHIPANKNAKAKLHRMQRGLHPMRDTDWPDGTSRLVKFPPTRIDRFI